VKLRSWKSIPAILATVLATSATSGLLAVEPIIPQVPADDTKKIQRDSGSVARELSRTFGDVAEAIQKSVVSISALERASGTGTPSPFQDNPLRDFFGDQFFRFSPPPNPGDVIRQGLGSGFVLDDRGHIVTNQHVLCRATEVRVTLWDGRSFDAEMVGKDDRTDVAILKIEADDLQPVELGDSAALRVGEWVVAAGNPFGLSATITTGIVSATGRSFMGITDYEYFIQTDAAINPGNSGGPLVNLDGQVVGINTAIYTRSGGSMGIGFAIPLELARPVIDSLVRTGKVVRGFLGVMIQDIDRDLAASFDFEGTEGALIGDVTEDSPADEAGLRQGDIITRFDGHAAKNVAQLRMQVAATEPGRTVEVEIFRDGERKLIEVELGELEGSALAAQETPLSEDYGWKLRDLTPEAARQLNLEANTTGVLVTEVEPFSPAARAGIRAQDIIVAAKGEPVSNLSDLKAVLKDADGGIRLTLRRGETERFAFLHPPR